MRPPENPEWWNGLWVQVTETYPRGCAHQKMGQSLHQKTIGKIHQDLGMSVKESRNKEKCHLCELKEAKNSRRKYERFTSKGGAEVKVGRGIPEAKKRLDGD